MIGKKFLREKINKVRKRVLTLAYEKQLSHLGSCLSCIEILVNLFFRDMRKKDKFILGKGHAGLAFYAILIEKGVIDSIENQKFKTHPEKNIEYGVEFTTGSLGQALSVGCGLALADKNRDVYVFLSEGDCEAGATWEAARFAVEFNLQNLKTIVDANGWQNYKKAENIKEIGKKWFGFGWKVINIEQETSIMNFNRKTNRPTVYIVKTVKGKGLPSEGTLESHYLKITNEQYEKSIRKRT